jgi:hypothetical protein
MVLFSRPFLLAALERAIKTAAQAVLVVWLVPGEIANALTLDWQLAAGVGAAGFVVSILTSVASAGVGPTESPSVIEER